MKRFLSFVRKEFIHILRDRVTMLILLVMPLILITLFGFAITTEVRNSRVTVIDLMQDATSHAVIQRIDANAYFSVTDIRKDYRNADEAIQRGETDAILILDPERGVQIMADGSEPNQAQTRSGYLQNIVAQTISERLGTQAQGISVQTHMLFNPQLKSEYNFVPGVIGMIIMLICVMMTSISIVREKEMGTMEILLASPLPPIVIILSKLIPYFVISTLNLGSILLLSRYVLGIPIAGSIPVFFLVSMVYIFVALALGLLISTAVSSQLAAMLLSLLLIVPTIYLSGLAFPIESMTEPLQRASSIIPARWYIDAARKILIQGVEFRYVVKDLGILCLEAVILLSIALKLFKTRLE